MATKSVCDVKSCGAIMSGPNLITVGDRLYDLCKKCHDGLKKFQRDYLGEGADIKSSLGFGKEIVNVPGFQVIQNPALQLDYYNVPNVKYYQIPTIWSNPTPTSVADVSTIFGGIKTNTIIQAQNVAQEPAWIQQGFMPFIGYNDSIGYEE